MPEHYHVERNHQGLDNELILDRVVAPDALGRSLYDVRHDHMNVRIAYTEDDIHEGRCRTNAPNGNNGWWRRRIRCPRHRWLKARSPRPTLVWREVDCPFTWGAAMDQRHQEYVEYYRARARKYENSPMYPHSAAVERAMLEAISTAANLEEFGERLRANKLDLACAIARVRDQAIAEANFYVSIESHVRAKPHQEVLETLDNTTYDNVQDLVTMVTEVQTRWNLPIARDETLLPTFWNDWKIMEDVESDEQAVVPEKWHEERRKAVEDELERGRKDYVEHSLPETRKFHPDYTPNYDELWETRHRRTIPLADDIVALRIQGHKRRRGIA